MYVWLRPLLMLHWVSFIVSGVTMVSTEVLLLHTAGATTQAAVAAILVRALVRARRAGEIPRGFIPISVLLSLSSLARLIRLAFSWLERRPPVWLELMTLTLLLITVLSVPAILSAHYLSLQRREGHRRISIDWIQWIMIATVVGVFAAFATTFAIGLRSTTPQMVAAGFTLLAILLWFRASRFRNWQLRKRGLLLFSGFTATALLGISANLLTWRHVVVRNELQPVMLQSTLGAATTEISNVLIVLGVLFVFASLQLADVIVKSIVALYIWVAASLALWKAATLLNGWGAGQGNHAAGAALLCVVSVGVVLLCTPYMIRRTSRWIDAWVFEIPDFDNVIHQFWGALSSLGDREAVYRAGEVLIKDTLRLAAVRIVSEAEFGVREKLRSSSGPNPFSRGRQRARNGYFAACGGAASPISRGGPRSLDRVEPGLGATLVDRRGIEFRDANRV